MKSPLILTSNDGTQTGRSGYDILADYLPDANVISIPRNSPRGIFERAIRKVRNSNAVSSWCMPSSWALERVAARELKRNSQRIVHMLWGDRDWGQIDLVCSRTSTPFVATVHACPIDLEQVFPHRNRHRLKNAAAIILMSEHQKPFFRAAGVPQHKLHVILHGVDCEFFRPGIELPNQPFTVIFVGNTRRDFECLYRVTHQLESEPQIRVRLICKKEHQEPFSQLSNVELYHGVSEDELLRLYQTSHVLLMPLLDCTANNAVLEAMACGLPVVASDVGGIRGYVDSTCSVLTPPGDAEAMATALVHLKHDHGQMLKLSQQARRRSTDLSWERQAEKVVSLYSRAHEDER